MTAHKDIPDSTFLEMRWRILSLAADFDRYEAIAPHARLQELRRAMEIVLSDAPARARRVQMLLSDVTPGPL